MIIGVVYELISCCPEEIGVISNVISCPLVLRASLRLETPRPSAEIKIFIVYQRISKIEHRVRTIHMQLIS